MSLFSLLGAAVAGGAMIAAAAQGAAAQGDGTAAPEPTARERELAQLETGKGANGMFVYIGTYSKGGSKGIYVYRLDGKTGQLTDTGQTAEAQNPSFVELHPNGRFLYAVSEGGKSGAVSAFAINAETGGLTFLNQQSSHGTSPCHLSVDATGKLLTVANYSSGTVAALPVQDDGKLGEATSVKKHEGSSVNPQRQKEPHAHSCTIDAANRFAFAADLGLDKILVYRLDVEKGELTPNEVPFAAVHPGAGPRHFAFHPSNRYGYVINEIDSTITAFTYDAEEGALNEIHSLSTLPADYSGKNSCADIHIDPAGKFLYGSNRGHDSIVIYSIDEATGRLTLVGHESTQGRTPRNFGLDPTGSFLLAANQDTNNVVVFRVDQKTGRLTPTGQSIEVPSPVCVKFLQSRS